MSERMTVTLENLPLSELETGDVWTPHELTLKDGAEHRMSDGNYGVHVPPGFIIAVMPGAEMYARTLAALADQAKDITVTRIRVVPASNFLN